MNRPIKILYTIPNFITAGSGRAMLNIIERLDRDWFSPAVCVSKLGGKQDHVVREMEIPLIEADFTLPAKPYLSLISRVQAASKIFKPYNFDLWHSYHYGDDYTEPLIARMSGARYWVYTKKNMNWYHNAWHLRSLFASRIAAQNTDMLQDFFDSPFYRRKVKLIPRGVDSEIFKPNVYPQMEFKRDHKIPNNAFLVGLVAHIVPVKGHPFLINAAAGLSKVHLIFAGKSLDEYYTRKLVEQVSSLGIDDRVHFLGNVSDVTRLLGNLDVVVLPTRKRGEGCPVALLEAMSFSKACIATDIPGARDIIKDGVSGLLVPPEDPGALAAAITRLKEDPDLRRRLGNAARKRVEEHYTIEQEVAAHERLYLELFEDCPQRP